MRTSIPAEAEGASCATLRSPLAPERFGWINHILWGKATNLCQLARAGTEANLPSGPPNTTRIPTDDGLETTMACKPCGSQRFCRSVQTRRLAPSCQPPEGGRAPATGAVVPPELIIGSGARGCQPARAASRLPNGPVGGPGFSK